MFGLSSWRRRRALARAAIDDGDWQRALARCRVAGHLDAAARERLRELVTLFIDAKPVNPVDGLVLTVEMRLAIALQACVPILELGIESYAPWVEVIVYPDAFIVQREHVDEAGVVHEVREPLSGEAWSDGPVILSWADVEAADPQDGYNVVLHEFAHKLDMLDGAADGVPPLHAGMSRDQWHDAFSAAFEDLGDRVDRWERGDPARLPLDPYALKDPAEFFACASEAFFETPRRFARAYPEVYRQLARFYRQDPGGQMTPGLPGIPGIPGVLPGSD